MLEHRFFLRVHMTAMLMLTLIAGVFTDRLLARIGVSVLAVRYFVSVAAAYAVFVSSVKLWLLYLGFCVAAAARRSGSSGGNWFDSFDFSSSGGGSSSAGGGGSSVSSFSGSGGKFGGGGATGSWGDSDTKPSFVPAFLSQKSSSSSSSKGGGRGGIGGDDLGELILVVLVIAVVVAIVASFLWLIWAAPAILSQTAFNAVLAGALAKHAHKASQGTWIGSIFKKTILPFAGILVLTTILGWYAQHYCPAATRLSEAIHCANPAF